MNNESNENSLTLTTASSSPLIGLNIEALLSKAIDAKSAVEVLERLQAMRREMRDEQARANFNEALSAFQAECPVIEKTVGVSTNAGKLAYKYAPLENIEKVIRPLLRQHGFSHTYDTDTTSASGWVIARCLVTHRDGHSRESTAKFPLGTKTAIMSDTQTYAAALTFANRRALMNAYGLVVGGEDQDGHEAQKPAGPSSLQPDDLALKNLARELWELLSPVRGNERNWDAANQWLWKQEILDGAVPEEAPRLTAERFKHCISKAREILKS